MLAEVNKRNRNLKTTNITAKLRVVCYLDAENNVNFLFFMDRKFVFRNPLECCNISLVVLVKFLLSCLYCLPEL